MVRLVRAGLGKRLEVLHYTPGWGGLTRDPDLQSGAVKLSTYLLYTLTHLLLTSSPVPLLTVSCHWTLQISVEVSDV